MQSLKQKRVLRSLIIVLTCAFVTMNVLAFVHAYKFTHFSGDTSITKTKKTEDLSAGDKLKTLLFGVNNPRPINKKCPDGHFRSFQVQSNKKLGCWYIPADSTGKNSDKGTIILFHGYCGEKSAMLDKAKEFLRMGYNTVLVDFMGSGESEGD